MKEKIKTYGAIFNVYKYNTYYKCKKKERLKRVIYISLSWKNINEELKVRNVYCKSAYLYIIISLYIQITYIYTHAHTHISYIYIYAHI